MNYYIDFDHTMYNTGKLIERMLQTIANEISKQNNKSDKEKILEECKALFNRENIYNIYELAEHLSKKYNTNTTSLLYELNHTILNCSDLVFSDVIPFLEKLKAKNHKIYILSLGGNTLQYQSIKIAGSNLISYFDGIFITSHPKYELELNYSNGIFIDDNPKDLLELYSKNPKKVIRIRREENKYSVQDLKNCNIEEYTNFDGVPIG